jgi:hypothetical protein
MAVEARVGAEGIAQSEEDQAGLRADDAFIENDA